MVVGVCDERDDVGGGGCGGAGGAPGGTRAGRARRRSTSAAPLTATGAPSLSLARYTALKPPRPTTRASSNPPVSASTSRHDSRRGDSSTAEHEKERERQQSRRGWQRRAGRPLDARTSPPPAPAQRAARSTRARVAAQVEAGGDIRGRASRLVRFARGGRWARRGRAGWRQDARRTTPALKEQRLIKLFK